ncbi:MAG: GNAT family N-acetyltransferase, partial [Methylobacteriaceae bacterium]|nr:GNAT family N-acetyltransferase [Methylobacteriaceae bacterium]
IEAERRRVWQDRFAEGLSRRVIAVAETGPGPLAAFACLEAEADPRWGTLIDNLHVDPARKGRGLGGYVLAAALRALPADALSRPAYLYVIEANARARAAYDAWSGEVVEALTKDEPDGSAIPVLRYAWPSAAGLLGRLSGSSRPDTKRPGATAGPGLGDESRPQAASS